MSGAESAVRPLDVLSVGEAIVDFFPDGPGISLAEAERFHRHLGGAPSNVAVGVARLGRRAGLMTLVGDDGFGAFLRSGLLREGVDVSAIGTHRTARTGITFITVGSRGERTFHFYRHPSADMLFTRTDVDERVIRASRVVHFGSSLMAREPSRGALLHALSVARAAGCLLSSDPNFRPHLWENPAEAPALILEALRGAARVKISDDELGPLLGPREVEAGARRLRELGVGVAVVTLGARGCYYDAPAGQGALPGERVEVVDTTGAGDAFIAALLAELSP
ncbi:MAG TPA: carbohydrate kinase, partial [Gemmatimonadales bacterium]|nr:carbohydrate kinase [Gemmatimonadales bacterium]